MVATYPGRSHGLGMYTEPLLNDLAISNHAGRLTFSILSFWATILGSLFCLPIGWLLDRIGQRYVLQLNFFLLGSSVLFLSCAWNLPTLFLGLLLTRGLGQAALSVVSITIVSHAHERQRLGIAMAAYATLSLPFHLLLIQLVGWGLNDLAASWRTVSALTGVCIIGLIAFSNLLPVRAKYVSTGSVKPGLLPRIRNRNTTAAVNDVAASTDGIPLYNAIRTGAFWAFSLTISLWGMIYAGSSLFNQDIFLELGFDKQLYFAILSYTSIVGLCSKLAFGWLNDRLRLNHLLAASMLLTSLSLVGLPFATQVWHAYAYATLGGIASGGIALLFFSCWGTLFGHRDLGYIQSVAQMLTVIASASGPVLFAWVKRQTHSYSAIFLSLGAIALLLSFWALLVPLPKDDYDGHVVANR